VSFLGMIWLYLDTGSTEKVADLSTSVFWLVLPSLPFFLLLPFLLKKEWGFYSSLAVSTAVMIGLYYAMVLILTKNGAQTD
jgi:C4-dicarboxylate transporter